MLNHFCIQNSCKSRNHYRANCLWRPKRGVFW